MKYFLFGVFNGIFVGFSLFMCPPFLDWCKLSVKENMDYTFGINTGVVIGLASLVGLLAYLALT